MPRGDRTGPAGAGPMTGRGLGYCSGYSTPGYMKGAPRGGGGFRGFGRGFGRGRGYRARGRYVAPPAPAYGRPPAYGAGEGPYQSQGYYGAPSSEEEELEILQGEAEALKKELDEINDRIEEIKSNQ